jgi:UTP-glucose-1-phosphate uridylyltransferase
MRTICFVLVMLAGSATAQVRVALTFESLSMSAARKNAIESYLRAELRGLGDVVLVGRDEVHDIRTTILASDALIYGEDSKPILGFAVDSKRFDECDGIAMLELAHESFWKKSIDVIVAALDVNQFERVRTISRKIEEYLIKQSVDESKKAIESNDSSAP